MASKTNYTVIIDEMMIVIARAVAQPTSATAVHTELLTHYTNLFDRLYHDFITPVDREDIARIGQGLCRLAQYADNVFADGGYYRASDWPCELQPLLATLTDACTQLSALLNSFWQFRKDNGWWPIARSVCETACRGMTDCSVAVAENRRGADDAVARFRVQWYTDIGRCFDQIAKIADTVSIAVLKNI